MTSGRWNRGGAVRTRDSAGRGRLSLAVAGIFVACVALAVAVGELPFPVLVCYLAASAAAFAVYALDKAAARRGGWRTPEKTLHLLALLGGWPGALVAQGVLRHKSGKRSFQILFWATAVLNAAALGWLLSPAGAGALRLIGIATSRLPAI
jgi:uncharacterized membrane protein YsdA (DUF1294 family)